MLRCARRTLAPEERLRCARRTLAPEERRRCARRTFVPEEGLRCARRTLAPEEIIRHAISATLLVGAGLAAGAGAALAAPPEPAEPPPAVVRLADGSSVPLRQWSLSYEYFSWPQGGAQTDGTAARREGSELWIGKKTVPIKGATLQIEYDTIEREREVDGETRKVQVPSPRAMKLVAAGKATKLKVEPPHRELMAPDIDKRLVVVARSLDLRGESLTGTKMDFCLLSYSTLVECGEDPEHQVMQVEFP